MIITIKKLIFMKTKILLFAAGWMITFNLLSQNPGQDYTNRMNYIFQYVDKNRITTGLLSDYGLQFIEPDVFNGVLAEYAGRRIMWITPCKRSAARGKGHLLLPSTPQWVELLSEFRERWVISSYLELRFAYTGLSTFKTYGIIIAKQSCSMRSLVSYLNLLK